MFANNYYALVAGLREYTLDADTKGFDAQAIVEEILYRRVMLHQCAYSTPTTIVRISQTSATEVQHIMGWEIFRVRSLRQR